MNVIFSPQSGQELEDAVQFYNEQMQGLGDNFYIELMTCISLICRYPNYWKRIGKYTRKCILKRFPYIVLYVIDEDDIIVTAIGHQHRNPEYFIV